MNLVRLSGRSHTPARVGIGMVDHEVTALVDRFGTFVVLTLVMPERLAEVAAAVAVELRRACGAGGADSEVAELAGTLIGLLDGAQVVTSTAGIMESQVHA